MDSHVRYVFVREVKRQAKFGLVAIADLDAALASQNSERVWYSIQSLLIAAGNVSKVLWPTKAYAERGQTLREALSISDDNVLAPRTFRNHFEHFDERLEDWAVADPSRNFVDSNIGPPGMISGLDPAGFLRNLDTKEWAVTFRGDAYQLRPIAAALQELHARAAQLKDAR
jgi:hypothetical protein